jgi:CheY-like chemotaxis protein
MTANRILIIEDNVMNLEMATDLLEAAGFEVFSAPSAEEGIRMAQGVLPNLVLMDIGLPGMDGLSATVALRGSPVTCNLTLVGFSAHAMNGDMEIALRAGCDGYVIKPIDTRTFVDTVKRFIEKGHARKLPRSSQKTAPVERRNGFGSGLISL